MLRLRPFKPRASIFTRLVLTFLLVIIPLYTLGLYLVNSGARNVREEVTGSMMARVHFYIQSLTVEFERIQKLQQEFLNDDDLQNLSVAAPIMTDLERTRATIRLQKRLRLFKSTSNYIESVDAYVPGIGRVINSQSKYESIREEEMNALIAGTAVTHPSIVEWNGRLFICQRYPAVGEPDALTFFLVTELSKTAIRKELVQFVKLEDEQAVLFSDRFDWSIATDADAGRIGTLEGIVSDPPPGTAEERIGVFRHGEQDYMLSLKPSRGFGITLAMYMPEESALGELKSYNRWFWLLSLTSVLIVLFFSFRIYRLIHRPMMQLVRSFRMVEKGKMDIQLSHNSRDEFEYLYAQFNSMLTKLQQLIGEVYEEKIRSQRAELKQLQAQINPHFLYNTFFILNRMVRSEDYPKLKPFTTHLGNYFKFITRNAMDEVELKEEVEFARAYLEIQKIRFEDRILVEFEEPPKHLGSLQVPRLTLQPIVENSYKYGLEAIDGQGVLRISFQESEGAVTITIEDNGAGMTAEQLAAIRAQLSSGQARMEITGLVNVHKRLQLKYGPASGVAVERSAGLGGLRVQLTIPIGEDGHVPVIDR